MNMDEYNSYLGQFITNFAHILSAEKQGPLPGIHHQGEAKWAEAQGHRQRLQAARDLLIANPVVGYEGKNYVCAQQFDFASGIEITPKSPSRISCVTSQASDEQHG